MAYPQQSSFGPALNQLLPNRRKPKHLIPGINHHLSRPTFITAAQYNALPSLATQPAIPTWILRRFGEIITSYQLQHALGAHLVYNRFIPSGIAEGSYVATTRVPLNSSSRTDPENGPRVTTDAGGGYDPEQSFNNPVGPGPTLKKIIWQSGIWELAVDFMSDPTINIDVKFMHGRLLFLSSHPVSPYYPSPSKKQQPGPSSPVYQFQPEPQQQLLLAQQQLLLAQQQLIQPKHTSLGTTHHFVAYEYEYGPVPPLLLAAPDAFWEDIADFLIENGLENCLGLEVLDPDVLIQTRTAGKLNSGPGRFVVEEYDPIRIPKATVVEVPPGKELSWSFSRSGSRHDQSAMMPTGLGEVNVEVGLVKFGFRRE